MTTDIIKLAKELKEARAKATPEEMINTFAYIAIAANSADKLADACIIMREALEGKHDGCNYLAFSFCNKCGKHVNLEAIQKVKGLK